ncbi:uncharacterized protein LOC141855075 [Brevipalpus obovatus]|uniref:uncharacterized protein LOC141855075 n=1 Tax=Brevipalpus obovatus TaxID=246614 RepID=UPI003D9ECAAF
MALKSSPRLGISSTNRLHFTSHLVISVVFVCCLSSIQSLPTSLSPSSPTHQLTTTTTRLEHPRILTPSLAIAMITGASNGSVEEYCLVHFDSDSIPTRMEDAKFINLNYIDTKFCRFHAEANSNSSGAFENEYLLIDYDQECPLNQSITIVKQSYPKIKGLIIATPIRNPIDKIMVDGGLFEGNNFSIAQIQDNKEIKKPGLQLAIYTEMDDGMIQPGLVFLSVVAILIVCTSGYSSGILEYISIINREIDTTKSKLAELSGADPSDTAGLDDGTDQEKVLKRCRSSRESGNLKFTDWTAALFVVYVSVTLLILYFLRDHIIIIMVTLFTIFSISSIYSHLSAQLMPYFERFKERRTVFYSLRASLLIISSIGPVTWFFIRKTERAWSLHTVLSFALLYHIIPKFRSQSYRTLVILSSLILAYDVFFVFITPLFTPSGQSIMEQVVLGGGSSKNSRFYFGPKEYPESLPFFLKIPKVFTPDKLDQKCRELVSTIGLGFGDIIFPGIIAGHCHTFDLFRSTPYKLYYTVNCISFAIGLFLTYVALNLMQASQPALLYLVPCTIIPPILISLYRKEFHMLWVGTDQLLSEGYDITCKPPTSAANSNSEPRVSLVENDQASLKEQTTSN